MAFDENIMKLCRNRDGQNLPASLNFAEENKVPYRLASIGKAVRREINQRFQKSQVNASYVFPRDDSEQERRRRHVTSLPGCSPLQHSKKRLSELRLLCEKPPVASESLCLPPLRQSVGLSDDSLATAKPDKLQKLLSSYHHLSRSTVSLKVIESDIKRVRANLRCSLQCL